MKGLVLEMKDESGKLAWMSGVATASSNAANSTWDPTAYLSELKAQGWTITAEICCAVDTLLASANPDVALRDRTGAPYVDESGGWVDLWNRDVRTYIEELCTDLMAMGVDEIILSRVEHPFAEVMYTREIASSLNREAFCMNFLDRRARSDRQDDEGQKRPSERACAARCAHDRHRQRPVDG